MSSVQDHYDSHLGPVYTWMAGGVDGALQRGSAELDALGVVAGAGCSAVDLGAGFGMHAIPLAQRGYDVLAVDGCRSLLDELRAHSGGLPIECVTGDLQDFAKHISRTPDLVLCMGDTLTHLDDENSVVRLVATVAAKLREGGRFVMTLRDYSTALAAEQRFVNVRSDANRILTCFLEYTDQHVLVHDILHEWLIPQEPEGSHWSMRTSQYRKLRIAPQWLIRVLQSNGFAVQRQAGSAGMLRLIAQRLDR